MNLSITSLEFSRIHGTSASGNKWEAGKLEVTVETPNGPIDVELRVPNTRYQSRGDVLVLAQDLGLDSPETWTDIDIDAIRAQKQASVTVE